MPSKSDSVKIDDPFLKRSCRLLPCQREMIHYWYARSASINSIARMFQVSKRLVQFELFPERKKKNIEYRRDRGGSKIYYNRARHTVAIKSTRQYKNKLFGTAAP